MVHTLSVVKTKRDFTSSGRVGGLLSERTDLKEVLKREPANADAKKELEVQRKVGVEERLAAIV